MVLYLSNGYHGGIAQLGERLNGIQEVSGSIPLISTTHYEAIYRQIISLDFYPFFDDKKVKLRGV